MNVHSSGERSSGIIQHYCTVILSIQHKHNMHKLTLISKSRHKCWLWMKIRVQRCFHHCRQHTRTRLHPCSQRKWFPLMHCTQERHVHMIEAYKPLLVRTLCSSALLWSSTGDSCHTAVANCRSLAHNPKMCVLAICDIKQSDWCNLGLILGKSTRGLFFEKATGQVWKNWSMEKTTWIRACSSPLWILQATCTCQSGSF